ncbi:MAG TPA: hypothetical protein DCM68_00110, partial [Verrucomicrobia bacterium]|nr:hypothetical protein [Verrucomicrobiota bacterium]
AYYGAWGGWEETAPARTRELYRLKRLSTRQQWAGHHAHQAIEFLLKNARRDPAGEIAASAEPRQIELMRREFRDSRSGAYRADPVHIPGLFEHEYHLEIPAAEWKAIVDRVSGAIRRFLASDLWQELRGLPDEAFLAVERRAHFLLDGLNVFAVPDLVVRRGGQVLIYDWKTGSTALAEHRPQLGIYALLALDRWTAAPDEIEAIAYNPVLGQRETFAYTADDLETLREFIRDSADEMLFPLEHPESNEAGDGSNFDCTESEEPCKTCPFLRACPRWQG